MKVAAAINDGEALTDYVFESEGACGADESDVADADESLIDGTVCPMNGIISVVVPNDIVALDELKILSSIGGED